MRRFFYGRYAFLQTGDAGADAKSVSSQGESILKYAVKKRKLSRELGGIIKYQISILPAWQSSASKDIFG